MRRLRILAALVGCFAALATGPPVFAAVSAPAAYGDLSMSASSLPCDGCQDFDGGHCAKMVDCTAPCTASMPTVGVASVELPLIVVGQPVWPARLAALDGEQPPPDPFPPRL